MELNVYPRLRELTQDTLDYFKSRHIVRVDEFIPYYHASFGCHILNLLNRKRTDHPIYTRMGTIPDLRLHMFFVGPPGFSKSFFCDIHLDKDSGVAAPFPNYEVAYLTLPGLIGSMSGRDEDGIPIKEEGVAETYKEHIIWCEEFSSVAEVMKAEHSAGMTGLLLMLTDNGKVSRNMKYGRIEYQSNATLLLGTQTERLEWISGMSRRFLFLDLNPTLKDMTDYNEAWELGEGIGPDRSKLNKLREGWAMLSTLPPNLIHIELTKEYLDFRAKLPVPHTDKDILNRLAIGWNFMNNFKWEDKVLEVGAPPELQRLVFTAIEMKYRIMGETGFLTIEKVLGDGKWHSLTETTWDLVKLGIGNYSRASARLREMISLGLIEIRLDKTTDRPRKLLRLSRTVTERAMTEG